MGQGDPVGQHQAGVMDGMHGLLRIGVPGADLPCLLARLADTAPVFPGAVLCY